VTWSSDDVVRLVEHLGFTYSRSNPHLIYEKEGHPKHVSIPAGRKVIVPATLGSIMRQIGITRKDAEKIRNEEL
jgi:predicted RNA binding protein YcfA (HicA-like mRNA interferase family)